MSPTASQPTQTLPLFDLGRQWPAMREEVLALVDDLAGRGAFSLGAELKRFEAQFAEYCGTSEAIGVANGTVAIELALKALGAGPGDEVVTVAHTFFATAEAVAATGATPVFVDIDARTRTLDPAALAAAFTPRTRAVVVVHLYGRPADMGAIMGICDRAGIPVVEDCAQAHGATLDGRRVGSFGAAGAFSFYPTKNLGAFGDGGAVTTSDPALAARVRSLRHHGSAPEDANVHLRADGGTERLDNLQAAILSLKLRRLDADNAARRAAAARYHELLADLPLTLPPVDAPGAESVHHLFVVEVRDRDAVRAALNADGVAAGIHYPTPAHRQPAFSALGYADGSLPVSEHLAARCLSLPIFPGITEDDQRRVAGALTRALGD